MPRSNQSPLPRTHMEAIAHFIGQMDAEMVGKLLDDNKTYQNFPKAVFMEKLQGALDKFVQSGDTCLKPYPGHCGNCEPLNRGFCFVGNHSRNFMSIVFEVKEDKVNDLCQCIQFEDYRTDLELNEMILIDKLFPRGIPGTGDTGDEEDRDFDIF